MIEESKIWKKYQKCRDYLDKKALVSKTNQCWEMYIGDQWKGLETGGEKLPSLNFIEPIVKYKVSVICQNSMTAKFSDMEDRTEFAEVTEFLNKNFAESWEKGKMNTVNWGIIEGAAVQGDSYAYWGLGDTRVSPQILPNTSVLLGDENSIDIQSQPFILIVERLDVHKVREIAKKNKMSDEDVEMIVADDNNNEQIGNTDEVGGKVTSILYMEKKNGIVNISRSTKAVVYEELHPIQGMKDSEYTGTGLRSYPIVSFIWKHTPNNARGVSEVSQLIPNQIELNKTLARRSMTVKMTAYPRLAYDETAISNPEDLDKVGVAIGVNGGGAQSINQMVGYLNATSMSNDAQALASDLLTTTRELAGAGDYATGNVNPEQASGTAIVAVRDTAQIPLNKQVSNYQQFVEDVALLFFDIWVAYNPNGIQTDSGIIQAEMIESMKPSVRVDVSHDNAWSKQAEQQWADNLFTAGQISLEEYVELSPDNGTVPKAKAKQLLLARNQIQEQAKQDAEQNLQEEG